MLTRFAIAVLFLLSLQTFAQRGDTTIYMTSDDEHVFYRCIGKMDSTGLKQGIWNFYYDAYCSAITEINGECMYTVLPKNERKWLADSGLYINDRKSGWWTRWDMQDRLFARAFYDTAHAYPLQIIAYTDDKAVKYELLLSPPAGNNQLLVYFYDSYRNLIETRILSTGSDTVLKAVIHTQGKPNNTSDYDSAITGHEYPKAYETAFEFLRRHAGIPREMRHDGVITKYHANGKRSGYYASDSVVTWYPDGRMASQSIGFSQLAVPQRSAAAAISPSGVTRNWDAAGHLIREVYEYKTQLPGNAIITLNDENGQMHATGKTDRSGLKHGYWSYYRHDTKGNCWRSEFGKYEHGVKTGTWTGLHPNGKTRYVAGFRKYKATFVPGRLVSNMPPRGDADQFVIGRIKHNRMRIKGSIITADFHSYYPDGTKEFVIALAADGAKNGRWQYFDSTGKQCAFREYRDERLIDSSWWSYPGGEKFRTVYYDSNGYAIHTKNYSKSDSKNASEQIDPADPFTLLIYSCDGLEKLYYEPGGKGGRKAVKKYARTQKKRIRYYGTNNLKKNELDRRKYASDFMNRLFYRF
jgi:hypothetical protein